MDEHALRFFPGETRPLNTPLARYLPPVPAGAGAAWLAQTAPRGAVVLDPLGASPALAIEAAQAGYRVIVACNNPILSFMIETLARAPHSADFQSAMAELAMVKRGDERLEQHIQGLYQTACDSCGEPVAAQAFLWRKDEPQPYARTYRCPACGFGGEHPAAAADLARLEALGGDRLQRSRALQRVIMNEDEHRADVEEALENYLPRPLYALFTLLNKIEGLNLNPDRLRLLQALLVSTFDQGSTLWPWPAARSRPRQLGVPPQFRENNIWAALEAAAAEWMAAAPAQPVSVVRWPALPPPEGGISLFRGRVKALAPLPDAAQPAALLAAFPRPSQAFWTLSTLWSGWLWGAEAALPLRNVLDRRRYDWNWQTSAVHSALAALSWNLPPQTPFLGILAEAAPGFLSAVVAAAQSAGFCLEGLAPRAENEMVQALWRPAVDAPPAALPDRLEETVRSSVRSALLERAEPAPYLTVHAAGLQALARAGAFPRSLNSIPGDLLTRAQAVLSRAFADRSGLRVYGGPGDGERGWWWLAEQAPQDGPLPLADRVEMEVVRALQKGEPLALAALDDALCAQFPGLLTPSAGLVRACLESYGEPVENLPETFRLRPGEIPTARRADLREMGERIEAVGAQLGFVTAERGGALLWLDQGKPAWAFYRMASSIISRYVLPPAPDSLPAERRVLVFPASRSRLLAFKLRRDPRLAGAAVGARLLKFRHLRAIAARPSLTVDTWEALLGEDQLAEEAAQRMLL